MPCSVGEAYTRNIEAMNTTTARQLFAMGWRLQHSQGVGQQKVFHADRRKWRGQGAQQFVRLSPDSRGRP